MLPACDSADQVQVGCGAIHVCLLFACVLCTCLHGMLRQERARDRERQRARARERERESARESESESHKLGGGTQYKRMVDAFIVLCCWVLMLHA